MYLYTLGGYGIFLIKKNKEREREREREREVIMG